MGASQASRAPMTIARPVLSAPAPSEISTRPEWFSTSHHLPFEKMTELDRAAMKIIKTCRFGWKILQKIGSSRNHSWRDNENPTSRDFM
jgi:hypothetical protein